MQRYNALAGRSVAAPRSVKPKETALSIAAAKVPEEMFTILSGHPDAGAIAKARFVDWCRDPERRFCDWRSAWKAFQEERAAAKARQAKKSEPDGRRKDQKSPKPDPSPSIESMPSILPGSVSRRAAAAAFIDSL